MNNTLKLLFINKLFIPVLILFFAVTPSFAQDDKPLAKAHVDSLKKSEEKLWYVENFKGEQKQKARTPGPLKKSNTDNRALAYVLATIGAVFKVFVWVVIALALAGAGYLIVKNLKDFEFRNNPAVPVNTSVLETGNLDLKVVNTLDLNAQIEKCIQDKNYRLAVRYYYLWVMKMLNEAQLIEFNIDKTNQDYTRELSRKTAFSKERLGLFRQCTHYYEYLWFGNFTVSDAAFLNIEKTFKGFLNHKA